MIPIFFIEKHVFHLSPLFRSRLIVLLSRQQQWKCDNSIKLKLFSKRKTLLLHQNATCNFIFFSVIILKIYSKLFIICGLCWAWNPVKNLTSLIMMNISKYQIKNVFWKNSGYLFWFHDFKSSYFNITFCIREYFAHFKNIHVLYMSHRKYCSKINRKN